MKMKFLAIVLLSLMNGLSWASSTAVAPHSASVDGIAAVVNNTVITNSEVVHRVAQIKNEFIHTHQAVPSDVELNKQVLNNLIDETLQLQVAKHMDITIDQADVDTAINNIAKQNHQTVAELKTKLPAFGLTFEKFQTQLKRQLLLQKIQMTMVGPQVKVDEAAVQRLANQMTQHHDINNSLFHVEDLMVHVHDNAPASEVEEAHQVAEELYTNLQKGRSFEEAVADQDSDNDDLKAQDLGWLPLDQLPEMFAKAVQQLRVGQIAQPIRTGNGFHLIKLVGVKDQNAQPPLTAKERLEQAHRVLFEREFVKKLQPWVAELRAAAYIRNNHDDSSKK